MSPDVQRDDAVSHRRTGHGVYLACDVLVPDWRALVEPEVLLDGHRPPRRCLPHSLTLCSAPRTPQPNGRRADCLPARGRGQNGSWTVGRPCYDGSLSRPETDA